MTDMSTQIFKVINLDSFAIYCNTIDDATTFSHIQEDLNAILTAMGSLVASKENNPPGLK